MQQKHNKQRNVLFGINNYNRVQPAIKYKLT